MRGSALGVSSPFLQDLSKYADLAELAARIGAGDCGAESALMVRWTPVMREIVRRHCRPGESQSEDLVQDIMCRLLARLRVGGIRDLRSLTRYFSKTAENACNAFYRKQGRRLQIFDPDARETSNVDPAEVTHQEQRNQLVREVVSGMVVPRDRELLKRHYLNGDSPERVCADLGIAREHFHRVHYRARTRIHAAMLRRGIFDSS